MFHSYIRMINIIVISFFIVASHVLPGSSRCEWLLRFPPQTDLQEQILKLASLQLDPELESLFDQDLWNQVRVIEIGTAAEKNLLETRGWNSSISYNPNMEALVFPADYNLDEKVVLEKYRDVLKMDRESRDQEWKSDYEIRVASKTSSADFPITLLVHELAHARFDLELRYKADTLLKKYPKLVRRLENGLVVIDLKFRVFLTERFAHEMEFLVSRTLGDSYRLPQFAHMYRDPDQAWSKISTMIFLHSGYDVNRRHLLEFLDLPLSEIFGSSLD